MKALLAFLTIVLPKAPELAGLFRNAFVKVGGTEADFDAILDANQKDIDRLGDPDSFRTKRPDPTPEE